MLSNETQELEEQENVLTSLKNSSRSVSPKKSQDIRNITNDDLETLDLLSAAEEAQAIVKKEKSPIKKTTRAKTVKRKTAAKDEDTSSMSEEKKTKTVAKRKTPAKKTDSEKKPAKKKETEKKSTRKVAKKAGEPEKEDVLKVITTLNRPFSIQDLLITLKNSIGKAALTRYLADFEEKEFIVSKIYNKTVIYCPKQSDDPINDEEMTALENKIEELKTFNQELKDEIQQKTALFNEITKYKDDISLKNEITDLKEYINKCKLRIQGLKSGGKVDEKEMNILESNFKKYNSQLKDLKLKFFNIVDALCDGMGVKRKAFFEEIGFEM